MLQFLQIENVAVIAHAEISFQNGFSVLTGETGAGKSIVIDAIHAVLGERASKDLIRFGCDRAEVSALFSDADESLLRQIREMGYAPDENGNILIRRVISAHSGGNIYLCGSPVTATQLRDIGEKLLNIHGQHDNQSLLNADRQLAYLDRLAENADLRARYYDVFHRINAVRKELNALESSAAQKEQRADFLHFQINELESANLKVGEYEALKRELSLAENSEKITRALETAYAQLCGDERDGNAVESVQGARRELLVAEDFAPQAEKLGDVLCDLEAVCADIRDFLAKHDFSQETLADMRDRQDFLRRVLKKYGGDETAALQYLADAKAEAAQIGNSDERCAELRSAYHDLTEQLVDLGAQLTDSRKSAAQNFAKQVCAGLRDLNMPHVRFLVDFQNGRYTKNGCDEIQFLISANAGEEPKPLAKIASGGELSRVMLVIKSVLADKDDVPTLIFDEVDTGVSGDTASKVGKLLQSVAKHRQVLCVTHLPQIAAAGDQHFYIEKSTENGRTYTTVTALSKQERQKEIARLMAGNEQTDSLLNSATELLDRSKKI